ncbi:uncharacterized protein LOC125997602 [Suncus etruscus]|uniref:uncharacterized protein LOC125997602 n=1 Tax=Suncus etruscus TaxID=109475 RepID=UPI00210FB2C3|nr:uncharacterized protein LOC125997602 [Suncus etruscus]
MWGKRDPPFSTPTNQQSPPNPPPRSTAIGWHTPAYPPGRDCQALTRGMWERRDPHPALQNTSDHTWYAHPGIPTQQPNWLAHPSIPLWKRLSALLYRACGEGSLTQHPKGPLRSTPIGRQPSIPTWKRLPGTFHTWGRRDPPSSTPTDQQPPPQYTSPWGPTQHPNPQLPLAHTPGTPPDTPPEEADVHSPRGRWGSRDPPLSTPTVQQPSLAHTPWDPKPVVTLTHPLKEAGVPSRKGHVGKKGPQTSSHPQHISWKRQMLTLTQGKKGPHPAPQYSSHSQQPSWDLNQQPPPAHTPWKRLALPHTEHHYTDIEEELFNEDTQYFYSNTSQHCGYLAVV